MMVPSDQLLEDLRSWMHASPSKSIIAGSLESANSSILAAQGFLIGGFYTN